MKTVQFATVGALLMLACGCAAWQKPCADEIALTPPAQSKEVPVVEPPGRKVELLPLMAETPVPALTYDVRGGLKRPPKVAGNLDARLRRRWKYIVIHHSASHSGDEAAFDRAHKARGWRSVGYHFVIGNGTNSTDGVVEVTVRWEKQMIGAHAASKGNEYNRYGIGICLVGNFEREYPTAKQMEALVGLVNYLQERCQIPTASIMGHRHIKATRCPGKNFPWFDFLSLLNH